MKKQRSNSNLTIADDGHELRRIFAAINKAVTGATDYAGGARYAARRVWAELQREAEQAKREKSGRKNDN